MIIKKISAKTNRKGFTTLCKCDKCGKEFNRRYAEAIKKKHQFCSHECFNKWEIGNNNVLFGTHPSKEVIEKMRKRENGSNNSNWKGGRTKHTKGYIYIYQPNHPFTVKKYVMEHRLIMEMHLGRYLDFKEVVHHINKIKDDNRLENLKLFNTSGEHTSHHAKLRRTSLVGKTCNVT